MNPSDAIEYSLDHLSQEPPLLILSQGSQSSVVSQSLYLDNNPLFKACEGNMEFGILPLSQEWDDGDNFKYEAHQIVDVTDSRPLTSEELEAFNDNLALKSSAAMSPISNPPSSPPSFACTSKSTYKSEEQNECEAIIDTIFNDIDLEAFELSPEFVEEFFSPKDEVNLDNSSIDLENRIENNEDNSPQSELPDIEFEEIALVSSDESVYEPPAKKQTTRKRKNSDTDFINPTKAKKANKQEQNREAAKRYREKKKNTEEEFEKQRGVLQEENDELQKKVQGLIAERKILLDLFVKFAEKKNRDIKFPPWFQR